MLLSQCFEWHCNFENGPQLPCRTLCLASDQTGARETREGVRVTFPLEKEMWPDKGAKLLERVHS